MAVELPAARPPERADGLAESGRRVNAQAALLVASLGALLAFLDATIVNVAFPNIQVSFPETSLGTLSWVLNAYNIVFAAFLVPAGRLADLLGRRRVSRRTRAGSGCSSSTRSTGRSRREGLPASPPWTRC